MPDGSSPAQSRSVRAAASASALLGRAPARSDAVPELICGLYMFMPSTSSIHTARTHDNMGRSRPIGKGAVRATAQR